MVLLVWASLVVAGWSSYMSEVLARITGPFSSHLSETLAWAFSHGNTFQVAKNSSVLDLLGLDLKPVQSGWSITQWYLAELVLEWVSEWRGRKTIDTDLFFIALLFIHILLYFLSSFQNLNTRFYIYIYIFFFFWQRCEWEKYSKRVCKVLRTIFYCLLCLMIPSLLSISTPCCLDSENSTSWALIQKWWTWRSPPMEVWRQNFDTW